MAYTIGQGLHTLGPHFLSATSSFQALRVWGAWLSASSCPFPTSFSHCALCSWRLCWIRGANEGVRAKATPLTIQGGLEEGWQRSKIPESHLLGALYPELPSFCPSPG